ncbi:hypothetical protein [Actinomycetospora chibensis]|uniref:Carboxymuconolactone decarboxylase-like domain-containing protein n=1 Tax=Actinomycetospora chibensis TaxID=663606 RepID=A0ABV9R9E6_9PSEU|nr:hypothetical protein [Actinomycetospora chibensis]MDD7924125.1 hypothetical protein [Actinomycetospora chibensis]
MARIPLHDPDDPGLDPHAKALLESVKDAQPDVGLLNVHRAMANHPVAMEQFFALAQTVYLQNSLPTDRMRELPYLTSAVANNCFY